MRRREFIQNTLGGIAMLATANVPGGLAFGENAPAPSTAGSQTPTDGKNPPSSKLRGVNLGAWLVLEKWMTPDTFGGSDAEDEYTLCLGLGDKAKGRLDQHRDTFITASDFHWIKQSGLNAIRLPVGYWALEAPKPYVE